MWIFSIDTSSTVLAWITQYGNITLFFLLALGILGLPIPEDSLIMLSGVLIAKGKFALFPTLCFALAGSICGITLSYVIGRVLGYYLLYSYGHWFGITHAKVKQMHNWFERLGKWVLPVGYFLPGVRHITGFIAGSARLGYRTFALFAYSGAVLWLATLLSLGYFLGNQWKRVLAIIENYELLCIMIVLLLIVFYITWHSRKSKMRKTIVTRRKF